MPWQVEFNSEWGCIHQVYSGTVTKQDVIDATAKALSLTRPDCPNLFLAELLDTDLQLSTIDIHAIPEKWQAAGANRANKLAIVVPADKRTREDMRFLEDTSVNRCWQVKMFSCRQLALDWLTPGDSSNKPDARDGC